MSTKQPSRDYRPWELSYEFRPVWAYPDCPAGHGSLFVDRLNSGDKEYRCHAPWCDVKGFDAPERWYESL